MNSAHFGVMSRKGLGLLVLLSAGLASAASAAEPSRDAAAPKPNAGEEWALSLTPQFTYGSYSKSSIRSSFMSAGVLVDAQYLERGGIAVGATRTTLKYSNGIPNLQQNAGFLSGRMNYTPDALPGILTVRGDYHLINNDDPTNETDQVRVLAPQVSYFSFDKSQYFDLGYAYTRYGGSNVGNPSLNVRQLTPTVGFGLNQGADWVQLRLYDIRFPSSVRTQNKSGTDALEGKWTHYMVQQGWSPEQIQFSALLGRRLFAVDGDTATVYNLADMQTGGAALGAQWKMAPGFKLQLNGGYNRYEVPVRGVSTTYSGLHFYTGVNAQW